MGPTSKGEGGKGKRGRVKDERERQAVLLRKRNGGGRGMVREGR